VYQYHYQTVTGFKAAMLETKNPMEPMFRNHISHLYQMRKTP